MSRRYCAIWASLAVAVAPTPYPTNGPPLNRQPSQQPQRISSRDPRSCSPARSVAAGCRFHVGGKRVAVGSPWKGGLDHEFAVNPDSHSADVVVTAQITQGGTMRQTEQERLIDLEAKHTFQTQTLRTIRARLTGSWWIVHGAASTSGDALAPSLTRRNACRCPSSFGSAGQCHVPRVCPGSARSVSSWRHSLSPNCYTLRLLTAFGDGGTIDSRPQGGEVARREDESPGPGREGVLPCRHSLGRARDARLPSRWCPPRSATPWRTGRPSRRSTTPPPRSSSRPPRSATWSPPPKATPCARSCSCAWST